MYVPQVFDDFSGGLNLTSKADAVGPNEAIDLLNVVFGDRGAVQQRPGFAALTSSALTENARRVHPYYTTNGTRQLLAACDTRLEAINTSGAVVASKTGLSGGDLSGFCRFGTPNSEYAYVGTGSDVLQRWDGSAWSSIASTPKASSLCVTPTSNRMVATRFQTTTGGPTGGASTSSPSHVYFSNAGAPETWTSTDYVQLDPGDGQAIQACVAWRDYVFVFKETKFYVFTGEGTASDGSAIFNYRKIDTGVGAVGQGAVAASTDGVYFMDRKGVYITTGDEPAKLSGPIDPIFFGEAESYFTSQSVANDRIDTSVVGAWRNMILVSYTGSSSHRVLVYDTDAGWWSLWNLNTSNPHFATFRASSTEEDELVFSSYTGDKHIYRLKESYTNDDNSAITSYWRGGFHDLGIPGNKRLRQQKVWGSGKVSCAVNADYRSATGTAVSLDFTTPAGAALNVEQRRKALRGTTFSVYLSNSTLNQEWSVHRLEHHIAGTHQPTVSQTETS